MKTLSQFGVILAVGIGACGSGAHVKQDADLTWRPAIDLVLSAFEQHPLVAVSEGAGHGQIETRDFVAALIRDRRVAPTVRNLEAESRIPSPPISIARPLEPAKTVFDPSKPEDMAAMFQPHKTPYPEVWPFEGPVSQT